MIGFIDDHREAHGVEPIYKVLPIAPSTYYDHVARRRDPARLSARAKRDMALKVEVRRVFEENFRVYGVRKVWRQLQREGFDVARCTVDPNSPYKTVFSLRFNADSTIRINALNASGDMVDDQPGG